MSNILQLARAHGLGPYKKTGDEYHGECPNCGGKDRHWLTPDGGDDGTGLSGCRHCVEANCRSIEFGVRFCQRPRDEVISFLGLEGTEPNQRFTVEAYSRKTGIPLWVLEERNIRPEGNNLLFPYYYRDGTEARPQMRARSGKQWWRKGDKREIITYGLDALNGAEELILNEGVSDWLTLTYTKFSALGVPGASMCGKVKAADLNGVRRVFIVKEADQSGGGDVFERNAKKRLVELGFRDDVFVIDMKRYDAKDPNELYRMDREGFAAKWRRVMDAARVSEDGPSILLAKPLREWMVEAATEPRARRLFGDCWFEGELCILFAETNAGKSILGIQIAQALASGKVAIADFWNEVEPMLVLYYDFELSARQFYGRYSDLSGNCFDFHPNLIRTEVSRDFDFEGEWADAVSRDMEALIIQHKPGAVILDNLTAIKDDTEKAKAALPLMRRLNTLKRRYDLSIMALAHTPKRDATKPLSRNDLAGSRNILNLCDSCFGIGESQREEGTRFLKQVKVRETDFSLTTDNVAFLSLDKTGPFLGFNFTGFGSELDHLQVRTSAETSELDARIIAYLEDRPGTSYREVAQELHTNHRKVGRVMARYAERCKNDGTGGTLEVQGGTGGTRVPVSHPSKMNGNGVSSGAGTVGHLSQVSHSNAISDRNPVNSKPDDWASAPTSGIVEDA